MPDNFTNDTTEMLVKYMDKELNSSENEAVKNRLGTDEKLNEQYQYLLTAKQAIRSQGLKNRVALLQNEFLANRKAETIQPAKVIRSTSFFKTFMRVAAVFIIAVAGFGVYEFASTTNQSVYNENYVAYQLPVNRGNESIDNISALYNAGKYNNVIASINSKQQKNQEDYFLTAQSYLQLNKPLQAIDAFKKLEKLNDKSNETYFVEETDYYLTLAYIKTGNVDLAKTQLKKITENRNHMFYSNAKKISQTKLKILQLKTKN